MSRPDRHFTLHLFQRRNLDHIAMSFIGKYAPPASRCIERLLFRAAHRNVGQGYLAKEQLRRESPSVTRLHEVYTRLDRSGGRATNACPISG